MLLIAHIAETLLVLGMVATLWWGFMPAKRRQGRRISYSMRDLERKDVMG